jgi:2'-phosphotransferase
MSVDGYISLDSVLARPKLSKIKMEHGGSPSVEDVMQVVESNDKKRFEVSRRESDQLFIRAVQGHSISEVRFT